MLYIQSVSLVFNFIMYIGYAKPHLLGKCFAVYSFCRRSIVFTSLSHALILAGYCDITMMMCLRAVPSSPLSLPVPRGNRQKPRLLCSL